MNTDFLLQQLFVLLQGILPPLIVKWVTGLVTKWKTTLTDNQITMFVVPVLSVILATIAHYAIDANFIWTFILGLAGIAFYEMKKNFNKRNEVK